MVSGKKMFFQVAALSLFLCAPARGAELPAASENVPVPVPSLTRVETPAPAIIAFFKDRTDEAGLPPVVTKKVIEDTLAEMKLTVVSVTPEGMYYLAVEDPKDTSAIRANMQRHPYVLSASPVAWASLETGLIEVEFAPSSDDSRKDLLRDNDLSIIRAPRKNVYVLVSEGPANAGKMAEKLAKSEIVKSAKARP